MKYIISREDRDAVIAAIAGLNGVVMTFSQSTDISVAKEILRSLKPIEPLTEQWIIDSARIMSVENNYEHGVCTSMLFDKPCVIQLGRAIESAITGEQHE